MFSGLFFFVEFLRGINPSQLTRRALDRVVSSTRPHDAFGVSGLPLLFLP